MQSQPVPPTRHSSTPDTAVADRCPNTLLAQTATCRELYAKLRPFHGLDRGFGGEPRGLDAMREATGYATCPLVVVGDQVVGELEETSKPTAPVTSASSCAHERGGSLLALHQAGNRSSARILGMRVIESVGAPVNVLMRANGPSVAQLADIRVARVTVGGSFAFAALGALVDAATELRDHGTPTYTRRSAVGLKSAERAFHG